MVCEGNKWPTLKYFTELNNLGKGGDEESLKTGNAGKRIACGIIGIF